MHKNNLAKQKYIVLLITILVVLVLDQTLKIWVKNTFSIYDEPINIAGTWLRMIYIENQGMAFGTTLGLGWYGKLALSLLRIVAIFFIGKYIFDQIKSGASTFYVVALGMVWAGATGNLLDSMFYDFIFPYEPCLPINYLEGSGIMTDCGPFGTIETRKTGFLFGNVVDMFQFNFRTASGKEIFPAIWNVADFSISVGLGLIIIKMMFFEPKIKIEKEEIKNTEKAEQ